jgi:hypothetical protein
MGSSFSLHRMHKGYNRLRGVGIAERSAIVSAIRSGELYWSKVQIAASRCRYLVIVDDPDYCRAGAAFDARNFPHVCCRGETVQEREVERRPIGSAL